MKYIRTEALIPAAPARIWSVLADFARYSDWNPLNIAAVGDPVLGAKVRMVFLNPAKIGGTITQTVTVTTFEPGRALAWSGSVPLLFKGRHHFTLTPEGDGCRLLHGEDLGGLIAAGFSDQQIERDFLPHYEATNIALAKRVAALAD